jgi:hypothetical protein
MPVKLHPINRGPRDNRYCGPAVVSFITGKNTSEVATFIRNRYRNGKAIRGTYDYEIDGALSALGYHLKWVNISGFQPTLAGWLKADKHLRSAGRVFLVNAGKHWQLISGRKYACGRIGEIVSIRDSRVKRRCRVKDVWEVSRMPEAAKDEWQKYVTDRKPRYTGYSYRVRKILRDNPQYGFSYEVEWRVDNTNVYYVSMSKELEDKAFEMQHHLCDEHYCYGLEEVLTRLTDMLEFAEQHH